MKKKAPDVDEMDGENEAEVSEELTDEPNYISEEEKLFDMDLDLKDPFDNLIEKHGKEKRLGTDDPFDPANWNF